MNAVNTWKKFAPTFNYYFFDDYLCKKFMKQYYSGEIYDFYCRLPLAVMKADIWRYCIIYKYGGIYADVDTVCKVSPNLFINNCLLSLVPENDTHLCQWVFSAPANSPILKSVIDLFVERMKQIKEIKGEHIIHFLTGPGLFTDGIEKYLKEKNKDVFENKKNYFMYKEMDILRVFNCDNFHANMVTHLYAGQDKDGWFHERFKKLI
jgi:mannosyltransferase OCH1-like enzyme